jgi:peptidoglycan/LPS O-acetylase OafA/YrhL
MQSPGTGISFRRDIQGLRAIAVAFVVLAHAGAPGFAGGFVGVDVFFVLSGYLITGLLVDERLATGRIRYLDFITRRLRRLLPAMLSMLLVVLLVASVILTSFEMRMQARSFPFAAAWVSNLFFAFAERDYFKALQDDDLFLHTWSLGVEEQFYLLWPWLVLAFVGLRASDRSPSARGRYMVVAMGMIGAVSLVACVLTTSMTPELAFYMMPARIWQFALGAMVFAGLHLALGGRTKGNERWALPAGLTGLFLIVASVALLGEDIKYPGWYALAPSLGAMLLIAAGTLARRNGVSALLERHPLVWIGDRSYSIYLWHWPTLLLADSLGLTRSALGVVGAIVASVVLAAISYRWVEYPFWKGRYRMAAAPRVVAAAVFAVVLSVITFSVLETRVFGSESGIQSEQAHKLRQDADPRIYSVDTTCDTGHLNAAVRPCPIGNRDGDRLAVLVGDSIGAQWTPLISEVFAGSDWQILVLTKSACAIVDKTWHYDKAGGDYVVCTEWRNRVLEYLAEVSPDVLIFGSSAFYPFSEDDWTQGTVRILERAVPVADQVILLSGTPRLTFDGPSCLEDPWRFSFRLNDGHRECEEAFTETQPAAVSTYLRAAAERFGNVAVLDLNDLVCPDQRCAAATPGGIAVFRDKIHLTASFTRSLVPAARQRLAAFGIRPSSPEFGTPSP